MTRPTANESRDMTKKNKGENLIQIKTGHGTSSLGDRLRRETLEIVFQRKKEAILY
jgi:hypothetical protein